MSNLSFSIIYSSLYACGAKCKWVICMCLQKHVRRTLNLMFCVGHIFFGKMISLLWGYYVHVKRIVYDHILYSWEAGFGNTHGHSTGPLVLISMWIAYYSCLSSMYVKGLSFIFCQHKKDQSFQYSACFLTTFSFVSLPLSL